MTARAHIILSIDTSKPPEAIKLAKIAKQAGAKFIKMGLELSSATSWQWGAKLAEEYELEWVADAKLSDIPNTIRGAVKNIKSLACPPFAITMHTTSGIEAMRQAQMEAGDIKMLGVTVLTSITEAEAKKLYRVPVPEKVMELAHDALKAGLHGIVTSPKEVGMIKSNPKTRKLFAMIPGTRSKTAERGDQARVATPAEAILDGADLLVIGREITQAEDPAKAYEALVIQIESALKGQGYAGSKF